MATNPTNNLPGVTYGSNTMYYNDSESATTAADVASREQRGTIQTGMNDNTNNLLRKNRKNYNNFAYFLSGIDVTQQNLDMMTPYVPGISRLFMHRTPLFMEKGFPDMTANFKSYIETGYKSVQGIGDLSADFIDIEGGWAAQKFSNISLVRDDTDEITVELYEQTGSPVREFIETWMTGVRDPRSGVAHYHGMLVEPNQVATDNNATDLIEYSEKNHTCEFIYIDLDPTARFIEYACMFAHCFPTKVPKSHLNYSSGNRGEVLMDVSFKVTKYEGRYINDIAAWYLAQDKLTYNYLEFNPNRKIGHNAQSIDYRLNLDYNNGYIGSNDSGVQS